MNFEIGQFCCAVTENLDLEKNVEKYWKTNLFLYEVSTQGAIQKGRHRGGEGGREAKLVTKSDKGGGR